MLTDFRIMLIIIITRPFSDKVYTSKTTFKPFKPSTVFMGHRQTENTYLKLQNTVSDKGPLQLLTWCSFLMRIEMITKQKKQKNSSAQSKNKIPRNWQKGVECKQP